MSGHTSWHDALSGASRTPAPEMRAFAEGYILALEDVARDAHEALDDPDQNPWGFLMQRVQQSLESARETLERQYRNLMKEEV